MVLWISGYNVTGFPHRCAFPSSATRWTWNVLLFPLTLHDNRQGVVLSARVIEKK